MFYAYYFSVESESCFYRHCIFALYDNEGKIEREGGFSVERYHELKKAKPERLSVLAHMRHCRL